MAAREFFAGARRLGPSPVEVTTDDAPVYRRIVEELEPPAHHVTEQYASTAVEADHGRLKSRLRPMRGLKRLPAARTISAGHALVQNLRRGQHELTTDLPTMIGSSETVSLNATDATSGIAKTEYRIDDGNWTTYTAPIEITRAIADGPVEYHSVDAAGNTEASGCRHRCDQAAGRRRQHRPAARPRHLSGRQDHRSAVLPRRRRRVRHDLDPQSLQHDVKAQTGESIDATQAAQLTSAPTAIRAVLNLG